jgi:hypothetical protein
MRVHPNLALRSWLAWLVVPWVACALQATPASAQTLKDTLKDHVREGIDRSRDKKEKKDKKKEEPKGEQTPKDEPTRPDPAPADSTDAPASEPTPQPQPDQPALSSEAPPADGSAAKQEPEKPTDDASTVRVDLAEVFGATEEPKKRKGPKLPVRVLGKDLQLDIKLGGGYRGWYPQQYDAVDVDVGNYATFMIDVKAKLFRFLNLRRGYYESNGFSGPRTEEAAVASQIGSYAPKAAWLLGVIGIPITKAWEPVIRYETRAFATRATPRMGVCVVDRDAPEDATEDCPGTMGPLKIISGFETLVIGVRYDHNKSGSPVISDKVGKIPPFMFGVGLMQYRKPYQLNLDGFTLEEYLFDGRFRGAGLAGGVEIGGGLDRFFSDIDVQLGLGEVSLTDEITLNELVPGDQLIGYMQGSASIGYRWPMIRAAPTLILVPTVEIGGASFFLVDTQVSEDERASSPAVNWDLLWSVHLSLLIPL